MLEPLNTEWNRKTGILPGKGQIQLLGNKHGITYFTWAAAEGNTVYLQCDEHVFQKHFKTPVNGLQSLVKGNEIAIDDLLKKKTKFLKYPFDVVFQR